MNFLGLHFDNLAERFMSSYLPSAPLGSGRVLRPTNNKNKIYHKNYEQHLKKKSRVNNVRSSKHLKKEEAAKESADLVMICPST